MSVQVNKRVHSSTSHASFVPTSKQTSADQRDIVAQTSADQRDILPQTCTDQRRDLNAGAKVAGSETPQRGAVTISVTLLFLSKVTLWVDIFGVQNQSIKAPRQTDLK